MSTTDTTAHGLYRPDVDAILTAIAKRHYANLATTSPTGHAHVAGVIYQAVDGALYMSTGKGSRKARNIAENPKVAVTIPVRRSPVGPPSSIQFQSRAELLDTGQPDIRSLADAGKIDGITGHGELELPDGCFLRIPLPERLHTYGLGMSLLHLIRHPLDAAGVVEIVQAD